MKSTNVGGRVRAWVANLMRMRRVPWLATGLCSRVTSRSHRLSFDVDTRERQRSNVRRLHQESVGELARPVAEAAHSQ